MRKALGQLIRGAATLSGLVFLPITGVAATVALLFIPKKDREADGPRGSVALFCWVFILTWLILLGCFLCSIGLVTWAIWKTLKT